MSSLRDRKKARRGGPGGPVKAIRIDFACNDPDTGHFTDECAGIQFPADFLCLESYWTPRKLRCADDYITLSGKRWPVVGYKACVGNWCWDAYWMAPDVATSFLLWLRGRDLFDVDSGWSEIFEWFKGEGPDFTPSLLQTLLCQAQRDHQN